MKLVIAAVIGLVALTGTVRAELRPAPYRPEWNAGEITARCAKVNGTPPRNPAKCQESIEFCASPLKANQAPITPLEFAKLEAAAQGDCGAASLTLTPRGSTHASQGSASWQSDVITGLVTFIVERARAEALASLVQHIQHEICGDQIGAAVMPSTCGLLGSTDPYTDPIGWSTLKAAFEHDAEHLPENAIPRFVTGDKAQLLIALGQGIVLLETNAKPIEIVIGLRAAYVSVVPQCEKSPYSCALWMLGQATEILAGSGPKPVNQQMYVEIASRLIHEAARASGLPLPEIKDPGVLITLRAAVEKLEAAGEAISTLSGATLATGFKDYRTSLADMLASLRDAARIVWPTPATGVDKLDDTIIRGALTHLASAFNSVRDRQYIDGFLEMQSAMKSVGVTPPAWFSKYGGFILEIATVESGDDARQVFEAAAAPVGSWRQKRGTGRRMFALQAYAGVQGGWERLTSADDAAAPAAFSRQGGLFAPVGIEMSAGFAHDWSAGFLLSVLDLGALVDVRSSGDKVATSSQIGFRQVFSPGAYAVLGLGWFDGIPLVLGAGVSMSPELRTFKDSLDQPHDANALRISVFLAIDVPIFVF